MSTPDPAWTKFAIERAKAETEGTAPAPAKGSTVWHKSRETGKVIRVMVLTPTGRDVGCFLGRNEFGNSRTYRAGEWRTNPCDWEDETID